MEFVTRFFEPPVGSYFLLGPRGTGKSAWTRRVYPDALVVDLLDPATERRLLASPEQLTAMVRGHGPGAVVIDEIQKVPSLLDVVHQLISAEPSRWQFVLTGSSARKLRRGGVNLLGGRAAMATFGPFMAAELGDRFDLVRALAVGLVPGIVESPDPDASLRAYAALYLREEVQAERMVRRLGDFARFLEAVSFSHGAVLNVAAVSRECAVERNTAVGFLEILEDLLLAVRVLPFTRRAQRATVAHPKFYWFDTGVFRSLRPAGPLDRPEEIAGAALEGLVFQHLRQWCAWRAGSAHSVSYWRTRTGMEVDFVVYGADQFVGIEVKHSATVRSRDLGALRAFRAEYPEAQTVLLYRGDEPIEIDGIRCLPVDRWLRQVAPSAPLPT